MELVPERLRLDAQTAAAALAARYAARYAAATQPAGAADPRELSWAAGLQAAFDFAAGQFRPQAQLEQTAARLNARVPSPQALTSVLRRLAAEFPEFAQQPSINLDLSDDLRDKYKQLIQKPIGLAQMARYAVSESYAYQIQVFAHLCRLAANSVRFNFPLGVAAGERTAIQARTEALARRAAEALRGDAGFEPVVLRLPSAVIFDDLFEIMDVDSHFVEMPPRARYVNERLAAARVFFQGDSPHRRRAVDLFFGLVGMPISTAYLNLDTEQLEVLMYVIEWLSAR